MIGGRVRVLSIPRPARLVEEVKSRVRNLDIPYLTVRDILRRYGLCAVGMPWNLPMSRRTRNVVVLTTIGRVVIKRYREQLGDEGIVYIHSILARLRELSFPAPTLIQSLSGTDYVSCEDGRYAVYRYINGSNMAMRYLLPSDRRRLIFMSGGLLGHFHNCLGGYVPSGAHHLGMSSYDGEWVRDVDWYAAKVQELRERSSDLVGVREWQDAQWLIVHSEEILGRYCCFDEMLRKARVPRAIVHGDYGFHNMVYQKEGRLVLTDYETARIEWRLVDLALAMSRFRCGACVNGYVDMGMFLMGYRSVCEIGEEELRYLAHVWQCVQYRAVFLYWNYYFESCRDAATLGRARQAYEEGKWAASNAGRLRSFASRG